MMDVAVKSCAPQKEMLLMRPTLVLVREYCSGKSDMRRSSSSKTRTLLMQRTKRCDDRVGWRMLLPQDKLDPLCKSR